MIEHALVEQLQSLEMSQGDWFKVSEGSEHAMASMSRPGLFA